MLRVPNVRTTFFACLFLLQLSVCCAGPARSSAIADKLRTLANIRRTTRNHPNVPEDYYRPDANELNQIAVINEPFVATTEQFLAAAPEIGTESTGIQDSFVLLDVTDATFSELHISHSITTESPSFVDFQEVIHPISNDRDPALENNSESHSLFPLPTAPSDSLDLPPAYPPANATTFQSATYIGIGPLPLMTVVPIPLVVSESPAVAPGNLPVNVGAVPLDWIPTVSPSYTSSQLPGNHPTDNSDTSSSVPTIPTKVSSSSSRPFGSSPQPRELGFPPVSNTHENFGIQVNWAEFR